MIFELLVVLVPLLLFYHFYWKRKDLPPGPIPLPIFGNLLSIILGFPGYEVLKKWSKQYGPIYTVWFTEMHGIMITDYKLMIETFQKCGDAYAGRTYTDSFNKIMREGNYGVIHTEGDLWQEHRRFALHFLRDFGLGKNIMEERILGEVADFIIRIKSEVQKGIKEHELWDHLQTSVGSIINALLFGYRFEGEKLKEYKQVKEYLDEMLKILTNPSILMMHKNTELFKYIPFFRGQYYGIVESRKRLFGFFDKQIEEHLKELNFDSAPTDYVDAFLREKAKRDAEGLPHTFHTVQLYNMCFDLWFAGQETTSSTLSWGMVYLMLNPEIQEKLHEELDKVIGNDRLVTLEDKKNLPYTNAVINETQRLFNILPINMPHKVTEDVEINGYLIKKGTTIVPQISNVLYDDKLFPEPYKFKPERFLTEDGQIKKCDELIPFSLGKRQCLGEGLARMELFLFTANIYNQFRISSVDGQPPSVVKKLGAAFAPQPYVCKIESKH